MNTGRLLTISRKIYSEIVKINLIQQLDRLVAHLESSINSPHESTQRVVSDDLEQLYQTLSQADSINFSPGIQSELDALIVNRRGGVNTLIGLGLSSQLENVFEGGYTSVKTLDGLRLLVQDVKDFSQALEGINNSFEALGIEDETLEVEESVVGMTIPRERLDGGLRGLQREISFFAQFLVELTETVEGSVDENEVYSLHASDFGIDAMTTLSVANKFAIIIVGIKAAFDTVMGYRDLKERAKKLGVDDKTVSQLAKESEEKMSSAIEEVHIEIFQDCKVDDKGRIRELKNGLTFRLNGLANRIDRGFSFEVRANFPEPKSDEDKKKVEKINAFSEIKFQPLSETRLLELPENGEDENPETKPKSPK